MYGENVKSNTPLVRLDVLELMELIKDENSDLATRTNYLRSILEVSEKKYNELKVNLPFYTSAVFHPGFRTKENFAAINILIIDLDDLDGSVQEVSDALIRDQSIWFFHLSPSGKGLKVGFKIEENIYDSYLFKELFIRHSYYWSEKHGLRMHVDFKCFDVTRASFLCHDSNFYLNNDSVPINIDSTLELEYPDLSENKMQDVEKLSTQSSEEKSNHSYSLTEAINIIKQKLGKKIIVPKEEREIFVPEEVKILLEKSKAILTENEIEIVEINPIQYGNQITLLFRNVWAELNVFFGRRGFSIVISNKKGSNRELAELSRDILNISINQSIG